MIAPASTLQWPKPGRGAWRLDHAHTFGPVTRVVQDVFPTAMAEGFRSFTGRYGLPISHIDVRYIHSFPYGSVRLAGIPASDGPPPPAWVLRVLTRAHPVLRRRDRDARRALDGRLWSDDLRTWFDDLRPARVAALRALQDVEPGTLEDAQLASHLERCVAALAAGFREHFSLVGASAIPVGLYVLEEGARGRSAHEAIADLAGAAAASTGATVPALASIADALAEADARPTTLEGMRGVSDRAAAALDAYLDEYGQRVVGALDVTGRRLIELPEVIVRSVLAVHRLRPPVITTASASDPGTEDARLAMASRDDHAGICCMWPLGLLRRALLEAGARLHAAGLLEDPDHALDAAAGEASALLRRSPGAPPPSVLSERRDRRIHLAGVEPPSLLGAEHPPPDPGVFPPAIGRMTAAMGAFLAAMESPGRTGLDAVGIGDVVHRGRAVVAIDPEDALARLEPGDVLVTPTTTPAFNCVLPIAGALVTVHGGPMSHAGIAARELGIPAVLGVADALGRIADGALIEVDPIAAEVRLAPAHIEFGAGRRSPPLTTDEVGGKAAGLLRMSALGLPIPPGVVVLAGLLERTDRDRVEVTVDAVRAAVRRLEEITGRRLGDAEHPLLVSVRSGAAVSMPGMLDTILNVGMTSQMACALARSTGDDSFAEDTHRRFLTGYAAVVGGLSERTLADASSAASTADDLFRRLEALGCAIPSDPLEQVIAAAIAVSESWHNERARLFRRREGIRDDVGTAITIQAMVFGNLGPDSGAGVAFSRDPSTGAPGVVADVVVGAQGDDVVGGRRSAEPLSALADRWPEVHRQLIAAVEALERDYADLVDVEFTVERGQLFLLQCRPGARSPAAAVRLAVEMAEDPEFPLERSDAVQRCRRWLDDAPLAPTALPDDLVAEHLVVIGLPASPGRGVGVLTVAVEDALRRHAAGVDVVLVRPTTAPADVAGMAVAAGVVTVSGGVMSHAALVARSWAVPAVVGAEGLVVDDAGVHTAERRLAVGELVTVDGSTGMLLAGAHPGAAAAPPELAVLRRWAAELPTVPISGHTSGVPSDAGSTDDVADLEVLRLVVLRTRTDVDAIAGALGATPAAVASPVRHLLDAGLLVVQDSSLAATAAGRDRIAADVAAVVTEHGPQFAALLDRFQRPDRALKQIVTEHQHAADRPGGATVRRIQETVASEATAIIGAAAALVPRLERYGARLDAAIRRLGAGDVRFLAHTAVESIHTVWFELHEELIRLAGTDRASEATAGRA